MNINNYITQAYSSTRYKSKRRGDEEPKYTKIELADWLFKNGLKEKWEKYLNSGCNKYKKPSIDRVDDYGIYEFSNMQLITWGENMIKGVNGKKHHKNSHNKNLTKKVYLWDKFGQLKKEFTNYSDAAIYLGCHITSISRAATGKRKTIKKHILTNFKTFTLL